MNYKGKIDFDYLRQFDNDIVILGHTKADFDAMLSGILLQYCLEQKGIHAEYYLQDTHYDPSFGMLTQEVGIKAHIKKQWHPSNKKVISVDHTNAYNNYIACFDHHPAICKVPKNSIVDDVSSCAKLIYDWAIEEGIEIPEPYLKLVVYSCYLDTLSFLNSKARPSDKVWCESLLESLGMDERRCMELGYDVTNKAQPLSQYVMNGIKEYWTEDGHKFDSTYIITMDDYDMDAMIEELKNMPDKCPHVFLACNLNATTTEIAVVTEDYVLTSKYNINLSRGKDVIPYVYDLFQNKNNGELTKTLIQKNLTVSTMESCTSGLIASNITDYEGASAVLHGSAITYSNEEKIKAGVPKHIIEKYGVYSAETSRAMSIAAKEKYNSDISVGITGSFSNVDPNNKDSIAGTIYFSINGSKIEDYKLQYRRLQISRKDIKQKTTDFVIALLNIFVNKVN